MYSCKNGIYNSNSRRILIHNMEECRTFCNSEEFAPNAMLLDRVLSEDPATLQELATEFGISRERVRQLEARIVARLREYLKENLVDFEYYGPPKD